MKTVVSTKATINGPKIVSERIKDPIIPRIPPKNHNFPNRACVFLQNATSLNVYGVWMPMKKLGFTVLIKLPNTAKNKNCNKKRYFG